MTVEPEATAWRCVWGSGNKTHSYLGQKSGPGFSREGGMRAVLVAVPDITTPLWLWPWSHPANSCLASQKLKPHLSQVCHTPFLQHWTCGCWHSFYSNLKDPFLTDKENWGSAKGRLCWVTRRLAMVSRSPGFLPRLFLFYQRSPMVRQPAWDFCMDSRGCKIPEWELSLFFLVLHQSASFTFYLTCRGLESI